MYKWYPKKIKRLVNCEDFVKVTVKKPQYNLDDLLKRSVKPVLKILIDIAAKHEPGLVKKCIKESIYFNSLEKDIYCTKVDKVHRGELKSIFSPVKEKGDS